MQVLGGRLWFAEPGSHAVQCRWPFALHVGPSFQRLAERVPDCSSDTDVGVHVERIMAMLNDVVCCVHGVK